MHKVIHGNIVYKCQLLGTTKSPHTGVEKTDTSTQGVYYAALKKNKEQLCELV